MFELRRRRSRRRILIVVSLTLTSNEQEKIPLSSFETTSIHLKRRLRYRKPLGVKRNLLTTNKILSGQKKFHPSEISSVRRKHDIQGESPSDRASQVRSRGTAARAENLRKASRIEAKCESRSA